MTIVIGLAILSALITAAVLLVALVAWVVISVWRRWKDWRMHALAAIGMGIAGPLVFFATHAVLWSAEFGVRHCATFADVDAGEVRHYLPPTAVDITIDREPHRHTARYAIDEASLAAHVDSLWSNHPVGKDLSDDELAAWRAKHKESLQGVLPASFDSGRVLHSPPEPAGGGCAYRYDRETGMASQEAWYW